MWRSNIGLHYKCQIHTEYKVTSSDCSHSMLSQRELFSECILEHLRAHLLYHSFTRKGGLKLNWTPAWYSQKKKQPWNSVSVLASGKNALAKVLREQPRFPCHKGKCLIYFNLCDSASISAHSTCSQALLTLLPDSWMAFINTALMKLR